MRTTCGPSFGKVHAGFSGTTEIVHLGAEFLGFARYMLTAKS
ncbi:MAG TPA: hypothetical protein VG759_00305 [Candidatus Angelobacter sp.]|nr:hypothetical protein [Candidatus Angelobacter sp.]